LATKTGRPRRLVSSSFDSCSGQVCGRWGAHRSLPAS
jgi:hypothetical protein